MQSAGLKQAKTLIECINSFDVEPLRGDDFDTMFCDTHAARTGNRDMSPILDFIDDYRAARECKHMLLMGHRGCGKSTEMYTFIKAMRKDDARYFVVDVSARYYLDFNAATYTDVLVMMMTELAKGAGDAGLDLPDDAVAPLAEYWKTVVEKAKMTGFSGELTGEAGIGGEGLWRKVLGFFGTLNAKMVAEAATRRTVNTHIDPDVNTFINKLREFCANVQAAWQQETGHDTLPIIVVDDLDRLTQERALDIFANHGSTLALLPMHVIYTFPIQLAYSSRFNGIKAYFSEARVLPMIKLRDWEPGAGYRPAPQGKEVLRCIVERRAELSLFTKPALDLLIEKTGGYLRDLFRTISQAARLAKRREKPKIGVAEAQLALNDLQSELGRSIQVKDYQILKEIYDGRKTDIPSHEEMLGLLDNRVIMEYNGKRWCDLHPLVEDLLKANGVLG